MEAERNTGGLSGRLLRTREVADLLSVSIRTICLGAECGEIPALRVGRQWRFRAADISAWVERKRPAAG